MWHKRAPIDLIKSTSNTNPVSNTNNNLFKIISNVLYCEKNKNKKSNKIYLAIVMHLQ